MFCVTIAGLHQSLHSGVPNLCQLPSQAFSGSQTRSFQDVFKLILCAVKWYSLPFSSLLFLCKSMALFSSHACLSDHGHVTDYWINLNFFLIVAQTLHSSRQTPEEGVWRPSLKSRNVESASCFPLCMISPLAAPPPLRLFQSVLCACTPRAMLIYLLTAMVKIEFYRCAWAHMYV